MEEERGKRVRFVAEGGGRAYNQMTSRKSAEKLHAFFSFKKMR